MESTSSAFRRFEYSGWQSSVSAYDRHFGPLTAEAAVPLLDAADAGEGTRVLDVATGPGYVARKAAMRGAVVVGIDFSEEMIAKARAADTDGEIAFEVGDAENLSFEDGCFDAVVMNFGVLHLAQPEKAFSEAHRVLKPGGAYGFTVWARPEEAQGFALMLKCIEAHGDPHVVLPPGPPFFRFSDPEESERCLVAAGFSGVTHHKLPLRWRLDLPDDLFEAFYAGTARTGGLLRAQSADALEAIRRAVREESIAFEDNGKLEIPMPALLFAARKT
jgi:ubiquinone/menaquinone biosynthesis C-methylase UbiE